MEKINYTDPEMEIIEFENEDLIMTSSGGGNNPIETPDDDFGTA